MKNKKEKIKIVIYGGSGLVGSRLVQILTPLFDVIAPSHLEVDLTRKNVVENHIKQHYPDIIIYAAGIASVDTCENYPKKATLLNAKIPQFIAKKASALNIPLFYLSTNAVFDGANPEYPYRETDKPNPISVYGNTKLQGENFVLSASNQNVVIRLIMVYSSDFDKKIDFARKIVKNITEGKKVYGITDQIINPVFVDDIAHAVTAMVEKNTTGIYHLGSLDYLTNYSFARKIANIFNLNESLILPISLNDFFRNSPGKRTKYYWLETKKFVTDFGNKILHTSDESLAIFKNQLKAI